MKITTETTGSFIQENNMNNEEYDMYMEQCAERKYEEAVMRADELREIEALENLAHVNHSEKDPRIAFQEQLEQKEKARIDSYEKKMKEFREKINEDTSVQKSDMVKEPEHYKLCGFETKDMIKLILNDMEATLTPYQAFCLGSILKYRLRCFKKPIGDKDKAIQDLEKAMQFEEMFKE